MKILIIEVSEERSELALIPLDNIRRHGFVTNQMETVGEQTFLMKLTVNKIIPC